jgi:hypothetical protein
MIGKRGGVREVIFGKRIDGPAGRRRFRRNAAVIRGQVVTQSDSFDVTLVDVSNTGAKMHGSSLPEIGQPVTVRIGPMEAAGTVAWSEGGLCGVQFATGTRDEAAARLDPGRAEAAEAQA